jgi:DNA replication protein DnaC
LLHALGTIREPDVQFVDIGKSEVGYEEPVADEPDLTHQERFLEAGSNIILVGGTGTGKTHQAISMARQAIKNGKRGRLINVNYFSSQ